MKKPKNIDLEKIVPAAIRELLGPPPLVLSESETLYYATMASFAESIRPTDFIDWLYVRDMTDARLEITRCRIFKSAIINEARRIEIAGQVTPCEFTSDAEAQVREIMEQVARIGWQEESGYQHRDPEREQLAEEKWKKREAEARAAEEADREQKIRVAEAATTERDLARAIDLWINKFEQLDFLQIAAENRFKAACAGLEQHRNGLGRALRHNVIEGEIIESPPPSRNRKKIAMARARERLARRRLARRKASAEPA